MLDDDALDAMAQEATKETSKLQTSITDCSERDLTKTLVRFSALVAPALSLESEIEAQLARETTAMRARCANLEWAAADRAVARWEKINDARERFGDSLIPWEVKHRELQMKISALERMEFLNAKEDHAMRTRAKDLRLPVSCYEQSDSPDSQSHAEERPASAPSTPAGAGHILRSMAEKPNDDEVDEMILAAARDGDGQVSFEEFPKPISPFQGMPPPANVPGGGGGGGSSAAGGAFGAAAPPLGGNPIADMESF